MKRHQCLLEEVFVRNVYDTKKSKIVADDEEASGFICKAMDAHKEYTSHGE